MVSMVEDNTIRAYTFYLSKHFRTADATGQYTLAAAGEHPKCKAVAGGEVTSLIYSTAADVMDLEHEDGGNVTTTTASTTALSPVTVSIAPAAGYSAVFERNEPICVTRTLGNAANTTSVIYRFVSLET